MLQSLSHIMVFAGDVMDAVSWYCEVLGFQSQYASPHYATLLHPAMGMPLHIHGTAADSPEIGHGPQPYFGVRDIDAAVAALRERGVSVEEPRSEGGSPRFTTFRDVAGNALGLTELR
jgi:predicted enzyme related to lactoylglutathione lyase